MATIKTICLEQIMVENNESVALKPQCPFVIYKFANNSNKPWYMLKLSGRQKNKKPQ